MPLIAPAEAAAATRRRASFNGSGFWHSTFLGANRYRPDAAPPPVPGRPYAVAFLVEQDPDSTVAAHFHQADQFQVVVAGDGTLGTHPVRAVSVHFTGAFSAYGPIVAGESGLSYFTLRNGWDPGARYMPGARAELPRPRAHREAVGAVESGDGVQDVIAAAPDGMGATRHVLAPGARLAGPDPAEGGGQYWVVLTGGLDRDGGALGAGSCAFVAPDEAAWAPVAGPAGAEILVLRFPRRPG